MANKIKIDDKAEKFQDWATAYNRDATGFDIVVSTKYGYVKSWSHKNRIVTHSKLEFIYNGLVYSRWFRKKAYTERGLITKSKRFAQDVIDGKIDLAKP